MAASTDRLEPTDVDCALMVGLDIAPDVRFAVESLGEIPFLHVLIMEAEMFDPLVDEVFGTDRWEIRKGIIEVKSWN